MRPFTGNAVLAWVAVVGFFIAASWPSISESVLPFLGLRNLSTPQIGWPLATATLVMAVFLSIPALLSRDRLLICAGFSLCLFFVVAIYVSPAGGIIFAFIGGNIIREIRRA